MVPKVIRKFDSIDAVHGTLNLPGDKSISHRALMFAGLAKGKSIIHNCLASADIDSTISCLCALGVPIERNDDFVIVDGRGFKGFHKPTAPLYAGNSGTTARLMSGILAAQNFEATITGDESLLKRPMNRIIEPLKLMGGEIYSASNDLLPLHFRPSQGLKAMQYKLTVASAQVKSAIILTGLHIEDETIIVEPIATRNHTENLLNLHVEKEGDSNKIFVSKVSYPKPFEIFIPADTSSAAFFIVLCLLLENSELRINNILLNETRIGFLNILMQMGANIEILGKKETFRESYGDILVRSSKLHNISIEKENIPNFIDEIPILTIAGIFAERNFEVRGSEELRFKECDRIAAVCNNLRSAGLDVIEYDDGFCVSGKLRKREAVFESYNDHRIAMAFTIFALLLPEGGSVKNYDCINISNPDFLLQLESI
ncbi:MAG: 3-phosphoshikimate 1-carboxyvinyltransferase [Ignavibacteria bacterium RBG_13_36_8]|nr:MAG: 3-phosphoshikimate 1-carboxyvinyltransferase [Ignavibacteria bacterium RBG_13_36_8]